MRIVWIALAAGLAFTAAAPQPRATRHPSHAPHARHLNPDALYSRRALHRARLLIQLRLLELHDARFACLRTAIVRRLPVDLRPQQLDGVLRCPAADPPTRRPLRQEGTRHGA